MVEEFIQEVVSKIDYELYQPLNNFISANENLKVLLDKLAMIITTIRKHIAKKKLNQVCINVVDCILSLMMCLATLPILQQGTIEVYLHHGIYLLLSNMLVLISCL